MAKRQPIKYGLTNSLHRVYPHSTVAPGTKTMTLEAVRGERISFQLAVQNRTPNPVTVHFELRPNSDLKTRVRRVGYVPVPHLNTETTQKETDGPGVIPGYVPDPLFDSNVLTLGPYETQAFWCSIQVPDDARVKRHWLWAPLKANDRIVEKLRIDVNVHDTILMQRQNLPILQWFYTDALCDFYRVEPFDERFWKLVEPYMRNMVEHYQDCIHTPLFTPPTDGVKRPTQLLKVRREGARYKFDWSDVKRWTDLAKAVGFSYFEWTHLFTQWGVKHAIRIYSPDGQLLWEPETGATSDVYRDFLGQFLPEFKRFLDSQKIFENSFFHVSDEPHSDHVENYRKARALLKELAPWMKTVDALSDITYGREGLTDLPVPICQNAPTFADEQIAAGVYYCCFPRGPYINRLLDTPLSKIRMHGWLFYRLRPKLFLHWGYNYWYKSGTTEMIDPFLVSDGMNWPHWAHGDPFCVYPGPNGPLDSIRWEVFAESMQDYALLLTLGVNPEHELLSRIHSYGNFPHSYLWIQRARQYLLTEYGKRPLRVRETPGMVIL